jgi:hypothetical protein
METYRLLIDEQLVIGWDNLLRGKFTKQWKIQQRAHLNRKTLKDPALNTRKIREKIRKEGKYKEKNKSNKKTENRGVSLILQINHTYCKRNVDRSMH